MIFKESNIDDDDTCAACLIEFELGDEITDNDICINPGNEHGQLKI